MSLTGLLLAGRVQQEAVLLRRRRLPAPPLLIRPLTGSVTTHRVRWRPAAGTTIANLAQAGHAHGAERESSRRTGFHHLHVSRSRPDAAFTAKVQTKDGQIAEGKRRPRPRSSFDALAAAKDYYWHRPRATAGGTTGVFGAALKFNNRAGDCESQRRRLADSLPSTGPATGGAFPTLACHQTRRRTGPAGAIKLPLRDLRHLDVQLDSHDRAPIRKVSNETGFHPDGGPCRINADAVSGG